MLGPRVLVFVASGCPHCSEFFKRFDPIATRKASRRLPVHLGDIARDPTAARLADRYRVRATPTTIGITRRGRMVRLEGAVNDGDIMKMFDQVLAIT